MSDEPLQDVPNFPIQIGESNQAISGIIVLPPSLLVEITVKDIRSSETWKCGPVPAPPPLESFGQALNRWRASITYPHDPDPPTRTLDREALRPYCWRYRYAYEYAGLDEERLKLFRLQLFREWEKAKQQQGQYPFRTEDRGSQAVKAQKAERRNFNDALDGYLEEWKKGRQANPYEK
jgi:hypothetical protein